eukprot:2754493-Rhodomonas_salina.1
MVGLGELAARRDPGTSLSGRNLSNPRRGAVPAGGLPTILNHPSLPPRRADPAPRSSPGLRASRHLPILGCFSPRSSRLNR